MSCYTEYYSYSSIIKTLTCAHMAVRIAARPGDSADRSLNSEGSLVTSKRHGIRLERSLKAHPHLHSAAVASWYLRLCGVT